MSEKRVNEQDREPLLTVRNDEIVTEQKVPRRSFLSATGLALTGAAGLASGLRASAQRQEDPDKRPDGATKRPDDAKKKPDDAKKKSDDARKSTTDPDSPKTKPEPDRRR